MRTRNAKKKKILKQAKKRNDYQVTVALHSTNSGCCSLSSFHTWHYFSHLSCVPFAFVFYQQFFIFAIHRFAVSLFTCDISKSHILSSFSDIAIRRLSIIDSCIKCEQKSDKNDVKIKEEKEEYKRIEEIILYNLIWLTVHVNVLRICSSYKMHKRK